MRHLAPLLWLTLAHTLLLVAPASAQKVDNKYRQFPAIGVEFKALKDFSDVPVNDRLKSLDIVAQMDAARGPYVKGDGGDGMEYPPGLKVLHLVPEGPTTGEGADEERPKDTRTEAKDFVEQLFGRLLRGTPEPEVEPFKAAKGVLCERALFEADRQSGYPSVGNLPIVIDVFTFVHGQGKVVFIWDYPAEKKQRKKWEGAIEKSMRSFRVMKGGATPDDIPEVDSDSSYEDLLKAHQADVDQTPGWRLIETRSRRYLIKTNSDDDKDIDLVIKRLEKSRDLYEEDFPPTREITAISVVRLCATRKDFNTYGQTGGGVAGYFNPRSEELVLFFGESGKAMTLSVMAHEAFHQYCHFLFDRAEAHRWFDEGHGDYYGAWKLKGSRLVQEEDMSGGLARVPELREMLRAGAIKPLSDHIRYSHQEWQTQGPSNVSCYAQSFGLVYFLRMGAKRKVSNRYWKDEYAGIIPDYMEALHAGYQAAFDDIRAEARKDLEGVAEDDDSRDAREAREKLASPWDFVRPYKPDIWEAAMKASWGKIDEAEFEQRWLEWVEKEL